MNIDCSAAIDKEPREETRPRSASEKKGDEWHFGYKAHIGVDRDSELVHYMEATVANVSYMSMTPKLLSGKEETVHGDSGYLDAQK